MGLNDGKINININKSINGELTQQNESMPQVEARDIEKSNIGKQAIAAALIDTGKQAVQQGFNSFVEISGDYHLQKQVNFITNISADALMVAKGGAVGAIAVATKYALGAANAYVTNRKENIRIAQNNLTLGRISREGSRYW